MWRVWQAHLRRVLQVETVVKFEVDESDKRSIKLHKRQHHSEIYITWHLCIIIHRTFRFKWQLW